MPADRAQEKIYAERVVALLDADVREVRVLGAQHGVQHLSMTMADGRTVFVKAAPAEPTSTTHALTEPAPAPEPEPAPDGGAGASGSGGPFAAEARGLRWLAEAGAVPVPEVHAWDESMVVISWLPPGQPTPAAADQFGRDLARMHAAAPEHFGAPWPGFIASLPLDNTPEQGRGTGPGAEWPQWYATHRVLPYLRIARDACTLGEDDTRLVEAVTSRITELAGPAEPPSRIHGDCWSGNVLWSGDRAWHIDPAAHGGHRETDLAMLALFGAPHLDRILAAYQETTPLADGWQSRVPLHQLHPLLVHACLFGPSYREGVRAALRP
jgi:fructosamine-3-kinase